ncbi:MAG TPA: hypothetical protein VLU92_03685 [Candidatus Dormibacteraeota bacterium]|nr:hypothetical protein [Candidatus Dormibacteraeota bacterium]
MQTTEATPAPIQASTPRWVWPFLLGGAALLLAWGLFVLSFKTEPSAVGRTGAIVILIGGASIGTAIVGAVATIGLVRHARWARSVAWFASALMIVTCVSSWAGLVGVVGLISGRTPRKT